MARARLALAATAMLCFSCAPDAPPASARSVPERPAAPSLSKPQSAVAPKIVSNPTATVAPPRPTDAELDGRYRARRALVVLRGEATYYGDKFAGRPTASGEPFDPRAFTAAHRTLPFGTVVRVVCPKSRRTVYVRINDRGPFGSRRRIIDLSRAAAERLDLLRLGIADVRLEVVELGKKRR